MITKKVTAIKPFLPDHVKEMCEIGLQEFDGMNPLIEVTLIFAEVKESSADPVIDTAIPVN